MELRHQCTVLHLPFIPLFLFSFPGELPSPRKLWGWFSFRFCCHFVRNRQLWGQPAVSFPCGNGEVPCGCRDHCTLFTRTADGIGAPGTPPLSRTMTRFFLASTSWCKHYYFNRLPSGLLLTWKNLLTVVYVHIFKIWWFLLKLNLLFSFKVLRGNLRFYLIMLISEDSFYISF